jgi:uncharacterized protein (TIGR00297 family)
MFGAPVREWIWFGAALIGIVLFIIAAETLRKRFGWQPEFSRKLVHILTGVMILFTPFVFTSYQPLVWMALLFVMVTTLGIRSGRLKGIHDTRRKSYGTVFYPLTFLILVLCFWESHKVIVISSMMILAFADAAAAIVGENLRCPHEYRLCGDKKSLEGSAVMFASSFLIITLILPLLGGIDGLNISWPAALWAGFAVALIATAMEALSSSGSDNVSAPLGAAFVLHFLLTRTQPENVQFAIGLALALAMAVLSYKAKFLSASGSVGTFLLAALIFGTGGWAWTVPILTFFILSSLLSKIGKSYKRKFSAFFEKSSQRDIGQVLANGSLAGGILLIFHFYPADFLYWLYLGALAAVTADTWATEIGVFSRISPLLITTFKQVPAGTSGGVTSLGTLFALIGAFLIAVSGLIAAPAIVTLSWTHPALYIIAAGGLLGSLVDSLIGATLQAQYQCKGCGKVTEKQRHCSSAATVLISGVSWLNNDWVNSFCSLSGVLFVLAGKAIFNI